MRRGAVAAMGVLTVLLLWRATLGLDMSDEAHVVALARRVATGAVPFRDEMNIQVLGSLPAVPFTWLWLQLVGADGLVVASRVFFLVLAAGTLVVASRALRLVTTSVVALTVPLVVLLMPAYNILITSYNTVPLLALVLGTSSTIAALRTRRMSWVVLGTATLVLGTACYPPMVLAAVLLFAGMLLSLRDRRLTLVAIAAAAGVAIPLLLIYWLVFTPAAIVETVSSTGGVLGGRLTPAERVDMTVELYRRNLPSWPWLTVAATACVAAVLARLRSSGDALRTVLLAVVPPLALLAALVQWDPPTMPSFALVSAVFLLVVVGALLPATVLLLARRTEEPAGALKDDVDHSVDAGNHSADAGDHSGDAADSSAHAADSSAHAAAGWGRSPVPVPVGFLAVVVIASLAQWGVVLMTTSSGPLWGIPVLGLVPAIMCLLLLLGHRLGARSGGAVLVSLAASLAVVLVLSPFKSAPAWQLTTLVTDGPFAGSLTTAGAAHTHRETAAAVDSVVPDAGTVMFYGSPGGYLLTEARASAAMLWLVNDGKSGRLTVDYFARRGEAPDTVLVHVGALAPFDEDWDALAASDPLIEWLDARYTRDGERAGPYFVLRPR